MPERRELYELYERAAQSPDRQARFVQAVVGAGARRLGEDFCGAGALSAAWACLSDEHSAIAVDHDAFPLGLLRDRCEELGVGGSVRAIEGDVRVSEDAVDVVVAFNFSIGYFSDRGDLSAYLRAARLRLGEGGVFLCDIYGGVDQFVCGESDIDLGDGARYVWEQREADPLTARVVNAMHFELGDGERVRDAFVYEWRLWSPAELRDALLEAGFGSVEFYDRLGDAEVDDGALLVSPADGDGLDENFVVYVAARA